MKESPTTVTKKQGWGGKRAGSGRKPYGARSRRRGSSGNGNRASGSGGDPPRCGPVAEGRAGRVRLRRQVFDPQPGA